MSSQPASDQKRDASSDCVELSGGGSAARRLANCGHIGREHSGAQGEPASVSVKAWLHAVPGGSPFDLYPQFHLCLLTNFFVGAADKRYSLNVKVAPATQEPPLARLRERRRGARGGIRGACFAPFERFRRASRNAPCKGGKRS